MTMGDRKLMKIKQVHTLESIARLGAYLSFEMDRYIMLSLAVEEYIKSQNPEDFHVMKGLLDDCQAKSHHFLSARQMQMVRLVDGGFLRILEDEPEEEAVVTPEPTAIESQKLDNIFQLFPKKTVD